MLFAVFHRRLRIYKMPRKHVMKFTFYFMCAWVFKLLFSANFLRCVCVKVLERTDFAFSFVWDSFLLVERIVELYSFSIFTILEFSFRWEKFSITSLLVLNLYLESCSDFFAIYSSFLTKVFELLYRSFWPDLFIKLEFP